MLENVVFVIILAVSVELVTVVLRLILHWRSRIMQKEIHMPRTHHSYIGGLMMLVYFFSPRLFHTEMPSLLLTIGAALVISDLLHHAFLLHLIKKYKYDIGMSHHRAIHKYAWNLLCFMLILWGLFTLIK